MIDSANPERQEQIKQGKRILRVYKGFGKPPSDSLSWFITNITGSSEQDKAIADLFRSNSFRIIEGGSFNPNNPIEIGISHDSELNAHERDKEVARKVGIEMPRSFTPEETIDVDNPIVVKLPNAARGEDKYLLETSDQKIRFIAWALLHHQLGELNDQKDTDAVIQRILKKVSESNFKDSFIQERGWLDSWLFEEYINSPGDYNTSFRVVADAFGNIHYSQVARSDAQKNVEQMPVPRLRYQPLEQISIPGSAFSSLLTHPDSPFYIMPKKFVSNVARGGKPLLLNGQPVADQTDRKILEDIGIDSDRPELPKELASISAAIGREYRRHFPHIGIDYMLRGDNRKFVLLEVNKGPNLRPEALGLPADAGPEKCELELMQRVIDKIPG